MGPQLKVVERSRTATMLCAASGNPDPEITWFKDFLPVNTSNNNGRIKQLRSGNRHFNPPSTPGFYSHLWDSLSLPVCFLSLFQYLIPLFIFCSHKACYSCPSFWPCAVPLCYDLTVCVLSNSLKTSSKPPTVNFSNVSPLLCKLSEVSPCKSPSPKGARFKVFEKHL